MNDPAVTIRFDGNGQVYRPGETLEGEYLLESVAYGMVKANPAGPSSSAPPCPKAP